MERYQEDMITMTACGSVAIKDALGTIDETGTEPEGYTVVIFQSQELHSGGGNVVIMQDNALVCGKYTLKYLQQKESANSSQKFQK